MSYHKVGVVEKQYDDHKNLLKRQIAVKEYISLLKSGREIINVERAYTRLCDKREASLYFKCTEASSNIDDRGRFQHGKDLLCHEPGQEQLSHLLVLHTQPHPGAG